MTSLARPAADQPLRILNLGAGVQSTTVLLLAHEKVIPPYDAAIFADTQEEPAEVYRHLEWLRSLVGGVPIYVGTAGKLGDDLLRGRNSTAQRFASIPAYTKAQGNQREGRLRRQCSKEYKVEVIERVIRREILGLKPRQRWPKAVRLTQAFGISVDEAGRADRILSMFQRSRRLGCPEFPLLGLQWTRRDCRRWLKDRIPHETPRSACVFCPYHSDGEWRRIRDSDPDGWTRAVQIDVALRTPGTVMNRKIKQPIYLHRSCLPLTDVNLDGDPRQQGFPYFALECEGVCGV